MSTTFPSPDRLRQDAPRAADVAVLARGAAPTRLYVVFLLLLVSSVAWRKGAFFSGGLDTVVVAKAGLTSLAFLIALLSRRPRHAWSSVRGAPLLWLVAYLSIATVGGLLSGDPLPSVVLAARVGLLAATLLLVVISHRWTEVLSAMAGSMLALALVGAATGIGSLAETGRLYGGIPPLNANEICFLVSVPLVLTSWRCVRERARWFEYAVVPLLLAVVWLTGSRTGMAALTLALLVVVVLTPRVPALVAALCACAIPVVLYITFFTTVLTSFAGRGGGSSVATLNSRTIAWESALGYHDDSTVGQLFGGGLSLKQVPVSAMYRSEQIIDSTWVSAILQAGYLGVTVLALLVLTTAVAAFRATAAPVALTVPLLVLVVTASVLESGMFDTTPAFVLFFTIALVTHRVPEGRETS